MLSHDNIAWGALAMANCMQNMVMGAEVLVSYWSPSSIVVQMIDIFVAITYAALVYFEPRQSLLEAEPTRSVCGSQLLESIYKAVMPLEIQYTGTKKLVNAWVRATIRRHWLDVIDGKDAQSFQYKIAKCLSKKKRQFCLRKCKSIYSVGAPLSADVKQ